MKLQIVNGKFNYADRIIFENINLQINDNDRIGLVGANGIGKSTLLKCIVGENQLSDGNINYEKDLAFGYLKQNADLQSQNTVYEELLSVFSKQIELLHQITELINTIPNVDYGSSEYSVLSKKYDRLLATADSSDAYNSEVKVNTVINGMGLSAFRDSTVNTLSGGEKTKVSLCKLLLADLDLLILDEPTNHLDYKTLDWLEKFLATTKCAILIVSHDRLFLDKLCNKIWDFYQGNILSYNGNYTSFKMQKKQLVDVQGKEYKRQQEEIAKLKDYIARNKERASTANMAKSRQKMLDRMDIISAPEHDKAPPKFNFPRAKDSGKEVLIVKDFSLAFGDRTLLNSVSANILCTDKVALIGLNGTGKSSLIKIIANEAHKFAGKIIFGVGVDFGYYDQENLNLDSNLTVLNQLWHNFTKLTQTEVRSALGRVGLRGEEVYKLVGNLSGGEKAKLGLCMLTVTQHNFLILDEPTNHLDLESREALELALQEFDGTILFVSHDRYFVNAIATKVWELDDKTITSYEGNYNDFIAVKTKKQVVETPKQTVVKNSNYRNDKERKEETNKKKRIAELETLIMSLEAEQEALHTEMSQVDVASNYNMLKEVTTDLEKVNKKLEEKLEEWAKLNE